jgi:diguanylate cyclase (GGDEF)-like protein
MADYDLFQAEEDALHAAVEVHAKEQLDAADYRDALGALITRFRRLVRETRRVIVHSDRQERELNSLNSTLQRLAAELDYKSKHDSLTGAFNRRAVIERIEVLLREGALALIVLDIDHFKQINDEHGHPVGDAVIVELVSRLHAIVPERAEIGRVGGEEFTVVLPAAELSSAVVLAESMRAKVAEAPFARPGGRTVTASFGVSYTDKDGTFDEAYGRADAALYEAKRGGRNRVVCHDRRD